MRANEAATLRWKDVDLVHNYLTLEKNKTDDPRGWDMTPGTLAALRMWRERFRPGATPNDFVFTEDTGVPINVAKLAVQLRSDLQRELGDTMRAQLLETTDNRQRLRAHDLRATFITVSLAAGKSETWISDRTGHTTSAMIQGYRRAGRARGAQEQGDLAPVQEAIPELNSHPIAPAHLSECLTDEPKSAKVHGKGVEPLCLAAAEPKDESSHSELPTHNDSNTLESTNEPNATPSEPHKGQSGGDGDAVEEALASALTAAANAGRWDVVTAIATDLEQRRRARSGNVVSIATGSRRQL